ncbi:MAG TPA: YciI family protein [Rudaea sp.]|jgi:uncharacterized protein YciI
MKTANGSKYLVIAPRTPGFDASVIDPHQRFLDELRSQGLLELTGPFTDKSGGAYLLSAASLAEAHAIVARDPLSTSGASALSVYEWAVST